MRLAIAQMNSKTGDIRNRSTENIIGNTKREIEFIDKAKAGKAEAIIFPEMSTTGYCLSDRLEDREFLERNLESVDIVREHTEGITAVVGFIDIDKTKRNEDGSVRKYNAAAVLQNRKVKGISRKTNLPNFRYFDDKRYFSPARKREPIVLDDGKRIGVSICEDAWNLFYKHNPVQELSDKGAELLFDVNSSPFFTQKMDQRISQVERHTKATGKKMIYVNSVGVGDIGKTIIPFDGRSMVFDEYGRMVFLGDAFKEGLYFIDTENMHPIQYQRMNRIDEIRDVLIMSIRDYVEKIGFRDVIVPISGGIDSAVVAGLAVAALGKDSVKTFNLPSIYNTSETKNLARIFAERLGVEYNVIPIQRTFDSLVEDYENNYRKIEKGVTKENIQARIRGMLMMAVSNDIGAMLLSCGNETEVALGYSTLYGDTAGGISPIGDLSKLDVYRVGRSLNELFGEEAIPNDIFELRPSAELSEGQYDPFDYSVVAPLVEEIVDKRRSVSEI